MAQDPRLTVVVTVVSDTTGQADTSHLQSCLEALQRQVDPPPMEVLVTCAARVSGILELKQRFTGVDFICVEQLCTARSGPSREHHDELRGIGIKHAHAPLIALIEDCGCPAPHWCAQLVKEHIQPYAAIGGAMENGINRALNWAVYFGDFGRYQNPVSRGPSAYVSDANVCYKRAALQGVAQTWAESYNEARVHAALAQRGETLALSPDVIVFQHRLNLKLRPSLMERYVWGRSFAAVRVATLSPVRRAVFAALSPLLPLMLLLRQAGNVLRTRRNRRAFLGALPLTGLLDLAWSYGEFAGYLTGRPAS